MASARAVPVPQPVREIVLTLSEQEAETLRAILGNVGGTPKTTRRTLADAIRSALVAIDVENDQSDISGSIFFRESV